MGRVPSQLPLFPAIERPPEISPQMRRDLAKLEKAHPRGFVRIQGAYASATRELIRLDHAAQLTAAQLARVDYDGRHPRLKITAKGRAACGEGIAG